MQYKYNTLKEIKELSKYKQLCKQIKELVKEPTRKNINNVYPLYDWYINACISCKEIQEEFEKEYFCNFIDVKDLCIGKDK